MPAHQSKPLCNGSLKVALSSFVGSLASLLAGQAAVHYEQNFELFFYFKIKFWLGKAIKICTGDFKWDLSIFCQYELNILHKIGLTWCTMAEQ